MSNKEVESFIDEEINNAYSDYIEKAIKISKALNIEVKDVLYDIEEYTEFTKQYNKVLRIELFRTLSESDNLVKDHVKGDLVILEDYKQIKKRIRNESTIFYEKQENKEVKE